MALLSRFVKKTEIHRALSFPQILKASARDGGDYSIWIRNHRWTSRNEEWCRAQILRFNYRPSVGILMQSKNPSEPFLRESLASIFNQVYPFHELSIVDRGSADPAIKTLLQEVEQDPRVKVSFQKGSAQDVEAVARIMKKADAEWILLMGAEDILEPNALYNMVASLQDTVDIDFVFSDSDMIDDAGLRFDPQFKPVWAVGSHYPLGYYQHPVLLHDRLVKKLQGHERISRLMQEGTLLDEASNHSRFVVQAPGILYHARSRGMKNEKPPAPVDNVFLNENLIAEGGSIRINTQIRTRSEPRVPLRIIWLIDSLEQDDSILSIYHCIRYLSKESGYRFEVVTLKDGALRSIFEQVADVQITTDRESMIERLNRELPFNVAVVSSVGNFYFPEMIRKLEIPCLWQIHPVSSEVTPAVKTSFSIPATVLFLSRTEQERFDSLDEQHASRVLPTGVDLVSVKTFKQRNSPIQWREKLGISKSAIVITICGPTILRKGQLDFVSAAAALMHRNTEPDLEFVIAGTRNGSYLDEIRGAIEKSGAPSKFHLYREATDPLQYYPYYLISDIVVSCSTDEIFPICLLEAMAMKKPVIGMDVFSTNEVIEDDGNGYLVPINDPIALAHRLHDLITGQEVRDFFGRRSLEIIYERFQFKKIAGRFEDFLRESIVL